MAFDSSPLRVEIVAADGIVWEGEAESFLARTTEGDIGILRHHEPILASLVPCAVEVLSADGGVREIIAIDGGFLAVDENRVSVLTGHGRMAREIKLTDAEREYAAARKALDAGDVSLETRQHYYRARAQLRAAHRAAEQH
ncbi:MAG: F0F1 ATP synthase subunit epsilon [Propioniciclava sp.]|uniref:F0F1 ATP synthase subunit epsilon n=1 Tax=Propioniciclava sp. TaxID=2038686 RepID=UPI0039E67A16